MTQYEIELTVTRVEKHSVIVVAGCEEIAQERAEELVLEYPDKYLVSSEEPYIETTSIEKYFEG